MLALATVVAVQMGASGVQAQPPTAWPETRPTYPPMPSRPPATSTGVPWQGTSTSPLTPDWSDEPRVAAAREYYLAQNPPTGNDYETRQNATGLTPGSSNVFGPPPVPRESGGRTNRDSFTTQPPQPPGYQDAAPPYSRPPLPRETTNRPATQWPQENFDNRDYSRYPDRAGNEFGAERGLERQQKWGPNSNLHYAPDSQRPQDMPPRDVYPLPPVGSNPPPNPGGQDRLPMGPARTNDVTGERFMDPPPSHEPQRPIGNPPGYPPARRGGVDRTSSFGGGSSWQGERDTHTRKPLPPTTPRDREPFSPPAERPTSPAGPRRPANPTPPADQTLPHGPSPLETSPTDSDLGLFEPARPIVIVGDQPILAGDLMPQIEQVIRKHGGKIPPGQIEQQKKLMMKQLAQQAIQTKLAYLDFLRTVPPERLDFVTSMLNDQFDETELSKAMQKAGVKTPAELDAKLREIGSSLEKQRRTFAETMLAREMIRQNVKMDDEVTHEEMLAYYREHEEDYFVPRRVRWEQLETRFKKFPSKSEAYRALAEMGNQVVGGAPLNEVARRSSQGFRADKGGQYDWTQKGSLRAKEVDEAIFSLPVGQLSQIIESENAFHIVRVIERVEDSMVPFVEAQVEIKEKIKKDRFQTQMTAYFDRLRQQTPVWSIFDEDSKSVAGPADNRRPLPPR